MRGDAAAPVREMVDALYRSESRRVVQVLTLPHHEGLPLPSRQTEGSAGYDVSSAEPEFTLAPLEQPVQTATTVRIRNGKVSTTDGPFAETKEQLGGYYLINARDLNDAIQVAAKIPSARLGTVEVRPIVEFDQP